MSGSPQDMWVHFLCGLGLSYFFSRTEEVSLMSPPYAQLVMFKSAMFPENRGYEDLGFRGTAGLGLLALWGHVTKDL